MGTDVNSQINQFCTLLPIFFYLNRGGSISSKLAFTNLRASCTPVIFFLVQHMATSFNNIRHEKYGDNFKIEALNAQSAIVN